MTGLLTVLALYVGCSGPDFSGAILPPDEPNRDTYQAPDTDTEDTEEPTEPTDSKKDSAETGAPPETAAAVETGTTVETDTLVETGDGAPDTAKPGDGESGSVDTGETGMFSRDTSVFINRFVDCNNQPTAPLSLRTFSYARGYHDVAFDEAGNQYGLANGDITKTPFLGPTGIFKPNQGTVQGLDFIANGDMVVARNSDQTIVKIDPAGAVTILATNINAYGVTIGPDDMAYVGDGTNVYRIDTAVGGATVLVPAMSNFVPRVVNWSPDLSTMYIVNIVGGGLVHSVPVDANLDPIGTPTVFASGVGDSWHDGLGVDACGNLYVPEFWSSGLYKVTPQGVVSTVIQVSGALQNFYGHGVEWGSLAGGWRDDAIYMPQPYNGNTMGEVVIGIPKARDPNWVVINAP